jgi:hypothetical protein
MWTGVIEIGLADLEVDHFVTLRLPGAARPAASNAVSVPIPTMRWRVASHAS